MAINRIRRNGSYAPLSAHYYKDDAIVAAGERAELLYLRGLAFCADVLSDGYISDAQLTRFVGVGLTGARQRAKRLVEVGLWERVEEALFGDEKGSGYRVVAWPRWNLTKAEIRAKQDRDAARKRGEE